MYFSFLLIFVYLAVAGQATPVGPPSTRCAEIESRVEWRDLNVQARLKYIEAVQCLHSLPPRDSSRGATSRYEEFQETHIRLTDRIHNDGPFLPWHRHFVTLYTTALRQECGYAEPTPYWDWTRDSDANVDILKSPIFDPVSGFGGDGVPGTYTLPPDPNNESATGPVTLPDGTGPIFANYRGCVMDGPFAKDKWTVHLGPGKLKTTHCLVRTVSGGVLRTLLSSDNLRRALETKTFEEFRLIIDTLRYGLHGGGHALVGGEMTNPYSSVADPLFFLHHAGLDKVWWQWQQADPAVRMYDLSGPTVVNGAIPTDLDFTLDFPGTGSNVTARQVMDASLSPSCFMYVL